MYFVYIMTSLFQVKSRCVGRVALRPMEPLASKLCNRCTKLYRAYYLQHLIMAKVLKQECDHVVPELKILWSPPPSAFRTKPQSFRVAPETVSVGPCLLPQLAFHSAHSHRSPAPATCWCFGKHTVYLWYQHLQTAVCSWKSIGVSKQKG